jgi:hypothetical protein
VPDPQTASCRCGQLTATATGDPVRISVCHCLDCQKRSGSAFAAQVRFPAAQVTIGGQFKTFTAHGTNGAAHFHFCPNCGSTVYYENDSIADTIAIALGAFADPYFVTPTISVWEERQHEWVEIAGEMEHYE